MRSIKSRNIIQGERAPVAPGRGGGLGDEGRQKRDRQTGGQDQGAGDGAEQLPDEDQRDRQGLPEVREEDQGAAVPGGRGREEPGEDGRAGHQAAGEDQDVQEADRGGRGDRRPQPGQVQKGPAGGKQEDKDEVEVDDLIFQELEEAEERSKMAEDQIEGMRRVRGSSVLVSEIKDDENDEVNHDDD